MYMAEEWVAAAKSELSEAAAGEGRTVSRDWSNKHRGRFSHKEKKVKERIALYGEIHDRATERHLPYGITQCYLPPDTGERAPP